MKIWIHINGVQEGPFDETNLPLERMNAATPVWYEGLSYWMPAAKAPVTAQIITNHLMQSSAPKPNDDLSDRSVCETIDVEYTEEQPKQQSHTGSPVYDTADKRYAQQPNSYTYAPRHNTASSQTPVKKPQTYLIWSILLTVLCCNPVGIVPIITGNQVTSKFKNFNYEGARKSSELTEWWLMITIVTSLMLAPLNLLLIQ